MYNYIGVSTLLTPRNKIDHFLLFKVEITKLLTSMSL